MEMMMVVKRGLQLFDDRTGIGIELHNIRIDLLVIGLKFREKGLFVGGRRTFQRLALGVQIFALLFQIGVRGEHLLPVLFQFGPLSRRQHGRTMVMKAVVLAGTRTGRAVGGGFLRGSGGDAGDAKHATEKN